MATMSTVGAKSVHRHRSSQSASQSSRTLSLDDKSNESRILNESTFGRSLWTTNSAQSGMVPAAGICTTQR